MCGYILFMENEEWDVYVSTSVHTKQNVRYYASL